MSKQKSKNFRNAHQKSLNETMRSLITAQEQQLQDSAFNSTHKARKSKGTQMASYELNEDQDEMLNVSIGELKDTSTDKISAAINELIAKNKITAKNAFEIPMIHLKQTKEYNSLTGDNNWKKISSTLDSNNKIYGYRVDATHNHTYKVLELLTRQEKQNKNLLEEGLQREEPQTNILQFENQEYTGDEALFKHLQKNYKGINIVHVEVFFNVNPILQKTKRIFDQQGLKGLLLNNIEIQSNLLLKLIFQSSKELYKYYSQAYYQEKQIVQDWFCDQIERNPFIFTKIYNVCYLNDLIQEDPEDGQFVKREDNQIEILWKQLQSLAQDKRSSEGAYQNLSQMNQEVINQHQHEQNHQENKQIQEQVQKQGQNIPNLFAETELNKNPQPEVDSENLKQPLTALQVITQEKKIGVENKLFDEQKELGSANQCQFKIQINEVSSVQSDNLTKTSDLAENALNTSKQIPISSVIRLNKRQNNCSFILKELEAGENEKDDKQLNVVETWKSGDKKARAPRNSKKKVQKVNDQINFLEELDYSGKKIRQKVLKIDKVRKLQLKKFMKDLNNQNIFDQYLYIDTSRYKFDFKVTTLYKEDQPFKPQIQTNINEQQHEQIPSQTNLICNQSTYINLIDHTNANQTKTVSLKYVKNKLQSYILQQKISSFADIYYNFIDQEGYITPALCFLTILHLTNQHGLRIQSVNDEIRIFIGQAPVA